MGRGVIMLFFRHMDRTKRRKFLNVVELVFIVVNIAVVAFAIYVSYNAINVSNDAFELMDQLNQLVESYEITIETQDARIKELEFMDMQSSGQNLIQHYSDAVESPISADAVSNAFVPLDVELSLELQEFTYNTCEQYDVPFCAVMALMYQESRFQDGLEHENKNGSIDYGLMQINSCNWQWIYDQHGLDIRDTYDNIEAGIVILADFWERYEPVEALTAYNYGEGGFLQYGVSNGAREVYARALDYKRELNLS